MLYDGICVCMFIWFYMWLQSHVAASACLYYIYIYICGFWYGSRWVSPECKMSMSLSPFGNSYICSYARIFTYTNTSKKDKSCDPCGPKFRAISTCIVYLSQNIWFITMAFYSVNMHHCDIKFPQQTWSHECMQMPRTLAFCQPTAAAQHYRMHGC